MQPDAQICRYCHFNFDTGIGVDGETPDLATLLHLAMKVAWARLKDGDAESALDQAFVALQGCGTSPRRSARPSPQGDKQPLPGVQVSEEA